MAKYSRTIHDFLFITAISLIGIIGTYVFTWVTKIMLKDEKNSNMPYKPNAIEEKFILIGRSGSLLNCHNNDEIEFKVNGYKVFFLRIFISIEVLNIILTLYSFSIKR